MSWAPASSNQNAGGVLNTEHVCEGSVCAGLRASVVWCKCVGVSTDNAGTAPAYPGSMLS